MRQRRIVRVDPLRRGWGQVSGTIVPVHLECGHVYQGNPTMGHKVGTFVACRECK